MTGKERLETLLAGGVPDVPPHWELVFQIPQAMFGMDPEPIASAPYGSEAARLDALRGWHADVCARLIEECHWAAVPPHSPYDPDSIGHMRARVGDQALVPAYEGGGVFWMLPGSHVMDFCVKLYERPDELHAEARAKCDAAKLQVRALLDAGADFMVLAYDFGYNDAPFVSPKHFAEFVTPYLTEIVQECHDLGKRAILHSDGCLNEILDQLHGTGLDGYQSVDPQGHMDIREVRARYPDWLLMGNVNCAMLQDGTEEEIRESVTYCMEHGGIGKRYILSTSNCIYAGMPPESYRRMLAVYRDLIAPAAG